MRLNRAMIGATGPVSARLPGRQGGHSAFGGRGGYPLALAPGTAREAVSAPLCAILGAELGFISGPAGTRAHRGAARRASHAVTATD